MAAGGYGVTRGGGVMYGEEERFANARRQVLWSRHTATATMMSHAELKAAQRLRTVYGEHNHAAYKTYGGRRGGGAQEEAVATVYDWPAALGLSSLALLLALSVSLMVHYGEVAAGAAGASLCVVAGGAWAASVIRARRDVRIAERAAAELSDEQRILLGLKKPRDYDDDSVDYVFDRANEQRRDRVRSDDAQRGPHHTSVTAPSSRAAVVRTDAGGGSSGRRSSSATNRWNNATSPPAREAGERWSEYVARWNEEEDEMTLRAFEASLEHENDASDDEAAANHRLASPFGDERSPVPREDTRGARGHQRSPNTSNTPSPLPASPLTYRPSPKDRTVSRQQRGDELWPTDEEEEEALRMLGVSPREWEDGPDLLREWISERLLRPLRRVCENSHAALSSALLSLASADEWERRFGLSVPLPPLGEDGDGGAFGSAVGTDLDSALLAVKTLLQQQMKQQHMQQQQQLSARALQALNTHFHLLYLLRGEYPSHLMAPMPPNYAMQKIRDLSEGTCCAAFTWDSGAAWGSRVHIWKDALPSDTHLIIYLFLAYIHSYGWSFPVDPTSGTDVPYGLQGSLFVGELPVMPSSSSSQAGRSGRGPYTAVLPVRPAEAVSEAFVLVCSPSTHPPQISVVEEDKLLMVLSGHSAAFRTIVLIIARARAMYGGALGLGMNIDSEFTQLFEGSFRLD